MKIVILFCGLSHVDKSMPNEAIKREDAFVWQNSLGRTLMDQIQFLQQRAGLTFSSSPVHWIA